MAKPQKSQSLFWKHWKVSNSKHVHSTTRRASSFMMPWIQTRVGWSQAKASSRFMSLSSQPRIRRNSRKAHLARGFKQRTLLKSSGKPSKVQWYRNLKNPPLCSKRTKPSTESKMTSACASRCISHGLLSSSTDSRGSKAEHGTTSTEELFGSMPLRRSHRRKRSTISRRYIQTSTDHLLEMICLHFLTDTLLAALLGALILLM